MPNTLGIKLSVAALGMALVAARGSAEAQPSKAGTARPPGPCDIYAAGKTPCVAAHSTTRALFAAYNGPLYQVMRSDGQKRDIGVARGGPGDPGGYADASAQDAFCVNARCWISIIYDQASNKNHLYQAPRGYWTGTGMGGADNLPVADAAPVTLMGHKVYGVFISPGSGMRLNDPHGTAVDNQAEGEYWVINGHHYNMQCCFNYGNAEIHSHADGDGTMEAAHFSSLTSWFHGSPFGPWVMTDQENNLVGCTNPGSPSKLCRDLPSISWRFVTGVAKGKPGGWASLGGDAQRGRLQVMYEGRRVGPTYDPMRKQGAIVLGNGGDNANYSQGTFYEGAMTAANTYPSNDTDQLVQANVVAARYESPMVTLAAAGAIDTPSGLQTFVPGGTGETVVRFVNTTGEPISNLRLALTVPAGWSAQAMAGGSSPMVAPGAVVDTTFRVTAGPTPFNGDMIADATWQGRGAQSWRAMQKLRSAAPVKINEFRIGRVSAPTNSFIELYNGGAAEVDISNWRLTQHPIWLAPASDIRVPAGTKIAPGSFYLLGIANSGLAAPARAGDDTLYVRSVQGLKVGDSVQVGGEVRRIMRVGTAAGPATILWQPMPQGDSVMTVPKGSKTVPVRSVAGFVAGQKVALGYGATRPVTYNDVEQFEIATLTAVGAPGAYAYLGAEAPAGATNISVTQVSGLAPGDKIRLDIDSVGHGIETVTVKRVGTAANMLVLAEAVKAGATSFRVRPGTSVFNSDAAQMGGGAAALAPGQTLKVGGPRRVETVRITAVKGDRVTVAPALAMDHFALEPSVAPGTGLDLAAPLKFSHAQNLPFSYPGSGLSLATPTAHDRHSDEPVIPLGTGIALDRPLSQDHPTDEAVRVEGLTTAGYQGPVPHQWFGGPALAPEGGVMVLRDAGDRIVDSLNYGLLVDPDLAEGYQARSGNAAWGCRAPAPGVRPGSFSFGFASSVGRFPDGHDTDSNCSDFGAQAATVLQIGADAGSRNLKVESVADFAPGQQITVGSGPDAEHATVVSVGAPGGMRSSAAAAAGDTAIRVRPPRGAPFYLLPILPGQAIVVGEGDERELNVIGGFSGGSMELVQPLRFAHPPETLVGGTGLGLAAPLAKAHAADSPVMADDQPTPGAPNRYSQRR